MTHRKTAKIKDGDNTFAAYRILTADAGHSQVACMFDTITMSIAQNTKGGQ